MSTFLFLILFRKYSDPRLENLAEISGGKTYFVKDGSGLEDINGVFEDIQTFQPTLPSTEAEIMVAFSRCSLQKHFTF